MFWNTEEEKIRNRLNRYRFQIQKFKRYIKWTDEQINKLQSQITADEKRLVEIKKNQLKSGWKL